MIVAELRVVPVGQGSSMEETVDRVCEALDDCEIKYDVGPVSTTFEVSNMEELMETVECCQEAALETAPRVILNLTIDQRQGEGQTAETFRRSGERKAGTSSRRGRASSEERQDRGSQTGRKAIQGARSR